MTDRTGPTPHACTICGATDMVPDIMPYCTGGDIKNPVHSWAHPRCVFAVMQAKNAVRMKAEAFKDEHEPNDGQ